jgi:hypothetical protein
VLKWNPSSNEQDFYYLGDSKVYSLKGVSKKFQKYFALW